MIIMTLEGIGISFGDTVLLQNVTQGIEDYDRIGVIGINGTGKSTLLAIIAGALQPDEGKIISRNGLKISYLPQNPVFDAKHSVLENVVQNISQDQEFWNGHFVRRAEEESGSGSGFADAGRYFDIG